MKNPKPSILFLLILLVCLCFSHSTHANDYVVGGFTLGEKLDLSGASYKAYSCQPSESFGTHTWCARSSRRTSRNGGSYYRSSSMLHSPDGTAHYIMEDAQPVSIDHFAILREIRELSSEIGAQPKSVKWQPPRQGRPRSVFVLWGDLKLEELGYSDSGKIESGEKVDLGILVDTLGNIRKSANLGLPIYRIASGRGFIYSASFGGSGTGHRHYVAIDASKLASKKIASDLAKLINQDQRLTDNDYSLWVKMATIMRRYTLDTSEAQRAQILKRIFNKFPESKLRSNVWGLIPGGVIGSLSDQTYGTVNIYGDTTNYPGIRLNIKRFLKKFPNDPFADLARFVIGDFETAVLNNPNSIISDVLHYAAGHKMLSVLMRDVIRVTEPDTSHSPYVSYKDLVGRQPGNFAKLYGIHYSGRLRVLNLGDKLRAIRPIVGEMEEFTPRAKAIEPHFKKVLDNPTHRHADDAAYFLGWLAAQQGDNIKALEYFADAMVVGNGDYKWSSIRMMIRIMKNYALREQVDMLIANPTLGKQSVLWYVITRSAYRNYDYAFVKDVAERGLKTLGYAVWRFPISTDSRRIKAEFKRANIKEEYYARIHTSELVYLLNASKELDALNNFIANTKSVSSEIFSKKVRNTIVKYSLLTNRKFDEKTGEMKGPLRHRDLRQAVHVINVALFRMNGQTGFGRLRDWLHYRKIRILAQYAPKSIADAVNALEQDNPKSAIIDDALVEQLYAEGVQMRDLSAARATFTRVIRYFPGGNAVDNAYSWMAIILRCHKKYAEARQLNLTIIRRFPISRHSAYALIRMKNPKSCGIY